MGEVRRALGQPARLVCAACGLEPRTQALGLRLACLPLRKVLGTGVYGVEQSTLFYVQNTLRRSTVKLNKHGY